MQNNDSIQIHWQQAKPLVDTLESMLQLHTTAALMTLTSDKIQLQSLSREKNALFRRTFYVPQNCTIQIPSVNWNNKRVHVVVNPFAILNSLHKIVPAMRTMFPKAVETCKLQQLSLPNELASATDLASGSAAESDAAVEKAVAISTAAGAISTAAGAISTATGAISTAAGAPVDKPADKPIEKPVEISVIEWQWNVKTNQLSQKLNIFDSWQLLPTELYQESIHTFYDVHPYQTGYRVSTHIGPTLNLDFIEMSILSPKCTVTVNPNTVRFSARAVSHSPLQAQGQAQGQGQTTRGQDSVTTVAECSTQYHHHHDIITKSYWVILPEFLLPELWERHQYSLNDVHRTLDAMPERLIWQFLIAYHLSPTNAATYVLSDAESHLTCGGKSAAITKIVKYLGDENKDWKQRADVTWNMSKKTDPNGDGFNYDIHKRHIPNLPVHRLSVEAYNKLSLLVGLPRLYQWRGISVIVFEENQERNLLMLTRVLPESTYNEKFASNALGTLREERTRILIDGQVFVTMEESFFFYCSSKQEDVEKVEKEEKHSDDDKRATKRQKIRA
jgi:hypothetical protein